MAAFSSFKFCEASSSIHNTLPSTERRHTDPTPIHRHFIISYNHSKIDRYNAQIKRHENNNPFCCGKRNCYNASGPGHRHSTRLATMTERCSSLLLWWKRMERRSPPQPQQSYFFPLTFSIRGVKNYYERKSENHKFFFLAPSFLG